MRYKHLYIILLTLVLLTGCGRSKWYGESAPPKKPIDLSTSNESTSQVNALGCDININAVTTHFSAGTLSAKQASETVSCVIKVMRFASNMIMTKTPGTLTEKELKTILNTRLLGDPDDLEIWIKRAFSLRDIIIGEQEIADQIKFSEVLTILARVQNTAKDFSHLSHGLTQLKQQKEKDPSHASYLKVRKDVFSSIMNITKTMLKDSSGIVNHDLTAKLLLKQYDLWDGLEKEVGLHYIESAYLANKILFGEDTKVIKANRVIPILDHTTKTYHLVAEINQLLNNELWTASHSFLFIKAYRNLLTYLLNVFLENNQTLLAKKDLVELLELLHANVNGEASKFVDTIISFKSQLFGSSLDGFNKADIRGLISMFDKAFLRYQQGTPLFSEAKSISQQGLKSWIDLNTEKLNASDLEYFQSVETNFPKLTYFWTTPFKRTTDIKDSNFLLTQLVGSLVEDIIAAYDNDQDGKLTLNTTSKAKENGQEIHFQELIRLVQTIQNLLSGLDLLTDGPTLDTNTSDPLDMNAQTLSKVVIMLADQFLLNSNGDNLLDKYEILDAVSFIFENGRTARWFLWDKKISDYLVCDTQTQKVCLQQEGLLDQVSDIETINKYFPEAIKHLSTESKIKQYIQLAVRTSEEDLKMPLSLTSLKESFAVIRLIETIMLKYDNDENGILDKHEIKLFYKKLEPFIVHTINNHSSSPSIPVIGHIGAFFTYMVKKVAILTMDEKKLYQNIFEYSLSKGHLPPGVFNYAFSSSVEVETDRIKLVQLFYEISKKVGNLK